MSLHEPVPPTREEVIAASSRPIPRALKTGSAALAVIGLVLWAAAFFLGSDADAGGSRADRAWRAFHFNWLYFTMISSAAVMFVAAQRITTARWSRPVVRFLEGYVAFLPVAWVLLAISVLVGRGHIFPWFHETPPAHEKQVYLGTTFFTVRVLAVFLIITLLQLWFVRSSLRLDVGVVPEWGANWARGLRDGFRRSFGEERREIFSTHSLQGVLAVVMALVWGFGWSILAFDLSMALDMHFYSTLYGWWFFMTGILGAVMSWQLLTIWWRRHLGAYSLITENHFHDIGKLCFAFTAFWGYLTFSQFLIIWYGNMPEETHFMGERFREPWKSFTFSLIFLCFLAPFLGLISRAAKVYLPTMVLFAVISLLGTWLQRYLEVYPSLYPTTLTRHFGLPEIAAFLFFLGTWGLCYTTFMDAFPRMRVTLMTSPFRDQVQVPYDPESMEPLPAHE